MSAFKQHVRFVWITTIGLLCLSFGVASAFADEKKDDKKDDKSKTESAKSDSSTKPAPTKPDAPVVLTEGERLLLEKISQLEKRIEELEAKRAAGASPATSTQLATASGTVAGTPGANAVVASSPSSASIGAAAPTAPSNQDQSTSTATTEKPKYVEPFSDADWTWLNGNPRTKEIFWDSKFFTPEIRVDTNYVSDFNHPDDHTIGGSSELFRASEVQLEQLGIGGDFHYDNVRGRLMTQFGMYSVTTPRNDPSPGHGQWDLAGAYRYISEAYGGYHINALHGINIDAGIFMSYIGLFSYYNFDNWAYQPSYVSSNTPWFFNGIRIQIFPTTHLKIEPWIINGWQAYASANRTPGFGGQIKWTPTAWMNVISNNYGVGEDDLFVNGRRRIHSDNSLEIKYFDNPRSTLDKMAFSLTGDIGCEYGAGVSCYTDTKGGPKQSFLGYMVYNRFWFDKDLFAVTVGGGKINNPGRYLVLLPPINGETAITAATNSPYFTENPGDPFKAWDSSFTFDYMPKQYITFRAEYDYRHANVPYWTGRGGITPPGGNTGYPQYYVCNNGTSSGQTSLSLAQTACGGGLSSVWFPDLRKNEAFIDFSILVKF